jgi:SAM-dependent methyltransferase
MKPALPRTRGLDFWIPKLLQAWREKGRRPPGPRDRLTGIEAAQIAHVLAHLSQGLTRERELAGARYFSDPLQLGAYLLYYWPLSYLQAQHVLSFLPHSPEAVLDLGSGPGPAGAAAWDAGAKTVTFADRSPEALALAGKLGTLAQKTSSRQVWDPERRPSLPAGNYDCILASHLLNELWAGDPARVEKRADLVFSWFNRLKPGGALVLLDPALTATSRDLIGVRDQLLARGALLRYPCLNTGPCPALGRPGETCHLEEAWSLPPLVSDLVRRLKFKKEALKLTAFIFTPPGEAVPVANEEIFQIVSDPLLSKNRRVRLIACGPKGRLSLALKPEQATPENRAFLSLKRGDIFRLTGAAPREGGLDLVPGSRIQLIPRPR